MPVAIAGMIVGSIALASIIIISIVGFNKANSIQGDYNTKMKNVVDQINTSQYYEYEFDKKHKAQTTDLTKNVDNVRNTYLTKDDATSTYVKKTDAATTINSQTLNVADNLKVDKTHSQTNNIRFSSKWTGFPDNATDKSEISNDTTAFKKLMVVGNKSAGGERRVGVWDRLDVHGNLGVDNTAKVNRLQLGDKFSLSGVGEAHGNDDWLRFFNKEGTDYYGGIAAGRLWSRDVSYLNGTTYINGTANMNGNAQFQQNGTGVVWGNNTSKIYDNGNLNIDTDDVMNIKAPASLSINSKNTNIKGNLGVGANIPGDWSGANFLRRDGRWSHLDWVGDSKNYLRGYTQIDDGVGVSGSVNLSGDIIANGGNNWIIHTPDDGRRIMYIAPSKTAGQQDWNWGRQLTINENGGVGIKGSLGVGADIPGDWSGANLVRRDGRWSHLDWKDNGQNYLRGYTNIDDGAGVNGDLNVSGRTTISRGDGNWNWLRVQGNRNDDLYLGSDGANRGIWANGTRDFTIFNQGQPGLTVKQNGEVDVKTINVSNKWRIGDTGDEWLRLNGIGKSNTALESYYGGFAAYKMWSTNYSTHSDKRAKENINAISNQELDKLSQLDPKSYQFINDKDKTKRYGFIAQDVEKLYPNLVSTGQDGMKTLNYTDMIPLTVAGIQQLNKQVQPDKICINNTCLTEEGIKMLNKQLNK